MAKNKRYTKEYTNTIIVNAIRELTKRNGYAPTYEEIGEYTNFSKCYVYVVTVRLLKEGILYKGEDKIRRLMIR